MDIIDLPSLGDDADRPSDLHHLGPQFFITALSDKPQNPIMDTINMFLPDNDHWRPYQSMNPPTLAPPQSQQVEILEPQHDPVTSMWNHISLHASGNSAPSLFAWDTLQAPRALEEICTPFLSEGTSEDFAIARHHVQPHLLKDLKSGVTYVTESELLQSLLMTVLGTSSRLFKWNTPSETFQPTSSRGKPSLLLVYGKDEKISASVVERFITIGTLLRRIDILLESLRSNSPGTSIIHAFTYALSSSLQYVRNELAVLPSPDVSVDCNRHFFIEAWARYAEVEDIVTSISSLCRRELVVPPRRYQPLPRSSEALLSHVYTHLKTLVQRSAPRRVKAVVAFILTTISQDYFKVVCRSVGLGAVDASDPFDSDPEVTDEEDELDGIGNVPGETRGVNQSTALFPVFFSVELASAIPRARKSLEILRAAQNNHPYLRNHGSSSQVEWFWTNDEIIAAWVRTQGPQSQTRECDHNIPSESMDPALLTNKYKEELRDFRVFDLAPGETLHPETNLPVAQNFYIRSFIATFPSELPSITPTLDHLSDVVLNPILDHTRLLSEALLQIFTSNTSHYNLYDHVYLLRSYLLLTSQSFRSRLEAACFSNAEDRYHNKQAARSLAVQPRNVSEEKQDENWAVGLAPGLMERQSWPPGGADLSFYLRTVIVDSLEFNVDNESNDEYCDRSLPKTGRARIFEEADHRLGFAIRDLPTGTGRERWLNPLSIEALDFLYMEYRPPYPLNVLITPEVISKYQRMFAFLLRLMRVENAIRSLYRMTRKRTDPLFPTLTSSNKLVLHFRFVAQSFVTILSTYVFDTAIRGNFEVLLSRISSASSPDNSFPDVFALGEYHSNVMDDVLSACLLRSGQKAAGDLLRGCLEYVLDLCNLAGMRREKRREEYDTAPLLEDLYNSFNMKMATLVTVLRGVVEREAAVSDIPIEYMDMLSPDRLASLRGVGSLRHLLHQLDRTHRSSQLP